ncbi:MAG: endo-1,4-beta-xylanase [Erythrobacter sp.]|uniref:endo-1,4-beta-xylanase n=1 Tax=Erythrobacter sp. TaxID=1042 RepID=UPI0032997692
MARSRGIRFGCAVSRKALADRQYEELALTHCDTLVGENALKWQYLEPVRNQYETDEAHWLTQFSQQHGRRMRGHCFVWNHHDRMPDWLVKIATLLRANESQELTRHMWRRGAFIAREFPYIVSWDAMNEAVDPTTGELRETHFKRLLGDRFLDLAFQILHTRLPRARLVYNETMSWEMDGTHRNGVLRLLERRLSRGSPIHALGIQSHIGKTIARQRDEVAWRHFLEEVQAMGVDVLLTELDCSDRNISASSPELRDAEVAAHTKGYLDLTLSFPNVREVLVWSLADKHSYMNRKSYPKPRRRKDGQLLRGHPFDELLRPKPMLQAIKDALEFAPQR